MIGAWIFLAAWKYTFNDDHSATTSNSISTARRDHTRSVTIDTVRNLFNDNDLKRASHDGSLFHERSYDNNESNEP